MDKSGLENDRRDRVAASLRGLAGMIPVAGGVVAEIVNTLIPNQRLDRISRFVAILNDKVADLDQNVVESRMRTEEMIDLFEEAARQASRTHGDERRERIATLFRKALTDDELSRIEQLRLLELLGEINDPELIVLRSYAAEEIGSDNEFFELHRDVLDRPGIPFFGGGADAERAAIRSTYEIHLERLGLLHRVFSSFNDRLAVDSHTGRIRGERLEITNLGRLLLQRVDFYPSDAPRFGRSEDAEDIADQ